MSCLYPIKAYRLHARNPETGKNIIVHNSNQIKARAILGEIQHKCGKCIECRLAHSRNIAIRCVHQATLTPHNSFLTLTYSDENLPADLSLSTRTMQLFWKKLRKKLNLPGLKYYASGEYGDGGGSRPINPHYHACLFGYDFPDKKFHKKTPQGDNLYRSSLLEDKWELGYCPIGDVTFESAAYCARYTIKKVYGDKADDHYKSYDENGSAFWRLPEQSWSSIGLAEEWLHRWKSDVYPSDEIVLRTGQIVRPPPAYDKMLMKHDPALWAEVEINRAQNIIKSKNNFTMVYDHANLRPMNVSEIVRNAQLKTGKLDNQR